MLFSRQNFVTYALTKTAILVNLSSPVIKFKIDIPMDSFISDHAASMLILLLFLLIYHEPDHSFQWSSFSLMDSFT